MFAVLSIALPIFFILFFFTLRSSRRAVYLLDFCCYKPAGEAQKCSKELVMERSRLYGNFTEETLGFMDKISDRSGLGQSTYLPEALLREPPSPSMGEARREAEAVVFGAVDQLLAAAGVKGEELAILVVNCSVFNVVPCLSDMVVNRYKLRDGAVSYNLSGMGCGAGLCAIGLAEQLLQVHRNSYALVVSTENITQNAYMGNDRSMVLLNCLFRVGGAAVLLSNRPSDLASSKYQLIHTVRSHTASSDRSYECIFQQEDGEGRVGVTITKDLMAVAIHAIKANVTSLGRVVLPLSEQILYLSNCALRRLRVADIQPYVPKFKSAFDHFFPHVGGKPVLDELERSLGFSGTQMEACRMTLYRFGNTSSSSVWYELAYAEAKGRIKRGDRVWQIAFGSGFKCSSAVWRATRTVDRERKNPWSDEIDQFPVDPQQVVGSFPYYFEPSE
ncbi:3-ketoacyl-CoA synthase 20-like [Malania oleifera]|uniref:3-ketoacyl-CoA synthase 20-like n=1 Tax=Malania oleifera TaxID=397392 RepID=UPI0025AE51E6|nr:3-ketoacyl-CoA synthase 20-like [Malania oleifera]